MNDQLIFLAQALDNASPDHVEVEGHSLGVNDREGREAAIALISRVSTTRDFALTTNGVRLIANQSRFIVDCPCEQRDSVGRIAGVVCCGSYDVAGLSQLGHAVSAQLGDFAKRIGQSVSSDRKSDILCCFSELEAKIRIRDKSRKVLLGAFAVLTVVILARCLAPKHSEKDGDHTSSSLLDRFE